MSENIPNDAEWGAEKDTDETGVGSGVTSFKNVSIDPRIKYTLEQIWPDGLA